MTDYGVVFCTVPSREEGKKIARTLVEERLAACVNIVPGLSSVYEWEGKLCEDDELLLVIKTRQERFHALESRLRELHSYDVPEILLLPVEAGSEPYLDWLSRST